MKNLTETTRMMILNRLDKIEEQITIIKNVIKAKDHQNWEQWNKVEIAILRTERALLTEILKQETTNVSLETKTDES